MPQGKGTYGSKVGRPKKKSPAKKKKKDLWEWDWMSHIDKQKSPFKMGNKKSPAKNYKKGYYGA